MKIHQELQLQLEVMADSDRIMMVYGRLRKDLNLPSSEMYIHMYIVLILYEKLRILFVRNTLFCSYISHYARIYVSLF